QQLVVARESTNLAGEFSSLLRKDPVVSHGGWLKDDSPAPACDVHRDEDIVQNGARGHRRVKLAADGIDRASDPDYRARPCLQLAHRLLDGPVQSHGVRRTVRGFK